VNREQNYNIDELLIKYLLGETSEAEDGQVNNWIKTSGDNERYYNQFKLIWDESHKLAPKTTIDTNDAWARFQQRTLQPSKTVPLPGKYKWLKVAAALLLLAGGSCIAYLMTGQGETQHPVVSHIEQHTVPAAVVEQSKMQVAVAGSKVSDAVAHSDLAPKQVAKPRRKPTQVAVTSSATEQGGTGKKVIAPLAKNNDVAKEFICNNTPSPIEICIVQSLKCKKDRHKAVSSCSVLEPDQSGALKFKAIDKMVGNCNATIDEIRITRITTGETFVLNASSKPATAQEFFNYITGQKKGDIVFNSECDDYADDCGLKYDNNYGNSFFQ